MAESLQCDRCGKMPFVPYPSIFDTIIIGAGPAGMTSTIYASRRRLKTLLICGEVGGQMRSCSDIENWTGVAKSTGLDLSRQFYEHVKQIDQDDKNFDVWVRDQEKVVSIEKKEDLFLVKVESGPTFKTKTVICTTGKVPRMLGIPGEAVAMKGNGLSFSATSDAPLYKSKKMVIIGGGNSAMDVTLQMAKYAYDITLMTNIDHLVGEAVLMEKVLQDPAVKVLYNVQVKEILLDKKSKVRGVRFFKKSVEGVDIEHVIDCEGIFEEVGQVPATGFLKGLLPLNALGEIPTDRRCQTSVPGFFAAGDCTDEVHKQVMVAAGQGAIAALEVHEYLLKKVS